MKKILIFVLFVSGMLLAPVVVSRLGSGFKLAKIQFDFPHDPKWEAEIGEEVREALSHPFSFLGKGTQCYVFESENGQWVVKFFRSDGRRTQKRLENLFNACKLAHEKLKEETGLVYIHLNQSKLGLPVLECRDALGRKYLLPMDEMRFLVQRKALGFKEALRQAKGDPTLMQKRIDQLTRLLYARSAKGVRNEDPSLSRNFGFLEENAIEFDFGSYRSVVKLDKAAEIRRFTAKLRRWLEKEAPEWVSYLDKQESRYVSDSI